MKTSKQNLAAPWRIMVAALSLWLLACLLLPATALPPTPTPVPTRSLSPTPAPTSPPTAAPTATLAPTAAPTPLHTATPVPLPVISLKKGNAYFTVDGRQSFVFMRNMAGYEPAQYERLLDLTQPGGSQLVRIQLDSMGMGYNSRGELDEAWAKNWEQVFDRAARDGLNVLPVFAGWFDWNNGTPDYGYSTWKSNPLNAANGGPVKTPAELFVPGSPTQKVWLEWLRTLVERWQGRDNIAAWEIFSEVNISTGVTEAQGVPFVEKAAAVIRAADRRQRPVTASLAEVGEWPRFYRSTAIDFINFHPYPSSGRLDTFILQNARQYISKYNKPVLIGESGLSALPADSSASTLTTAENAAVGLKHAIWASLVSGAMDGRALYWEDSFAIFFPSLSWAFIEKNADAEWPASRFAQDVDFAGFKPVPARFSAKVVGAALGHSKAVIGWVRDAGCEPPDWVIQPIIAKQAVTLTVPGSAAKWNVNFYRTQTGTDVISSTTVTRQGNVLILALPDFSDDIAFKMVAQIVGNAATTTAPARAPVTTDPIAGQWTGTITSETGSFSATIVLVIQPGCKVGGVCGTVSTPEQCSGSLVLQSVSRGRFNFLEQNMTGASGCVSGGIEQLQLQPQGTLSFGYTYTSADGQTLASSGALQRP